VAGSGGGLPVFKEGVTKRHRRADRALKEFVAFSDSAGEPIGRASAVATGLACDDEIVAAVAAIGAAAQMLQGSPVRILLATRLVGDRDRAPAVAALPALAVFQIADR
jgi:hypothetical protein